MVFSLVVSILFAVASSGHAGSCDNVVVLTNSWSAGWQAEIRVPITAPISAWSIQLGLSSAITALETWVSQPSTSDNKSFNLINYSWNGAQAAGSTLAVGFLVRFPDGSVPPTVSSLTFNGQNLCSSSAASTTAIPVTTTTAAPTTAAIVTTTTTTAPTTTIPANTQTSCSNVVQLTNSWAGGWQADIKIPITTTVTSWTIKLGFSIVISSLEVWTAQASTTDNKNFNLVNLSYNGYQAAGATLVVNFLVRYPDTLTAPTVTSVLFNGKSVCTSSGTTAASSTTIIPATTTTTTTAKTTFSTTTPSGVTTITTPTTTTKSSVTTTSTPVNTKYNYGDALAKSILFYAAERSGKLPINNTIPYRWDSALNDKGANGEDLTGGYYDAGDHVKFGFPMAYTVTVLAWSLIEYENAYTAAGQLSNMRDTVKWGSDYFIKAHVAPNKLYGQVGDGDADHAYWGRPEQMTMARPAYYIDATKPGSDLAGETAAALAATSIAFANVNATYSALCLSHAKQLYAFADQYRATYDSSIPQASNFYKSWSGYGDELAWAAAWLYRATNDATYLTAAQNHYSSFGLGNTPETFSWDSKTAGVQVLLAKLTQQTQYSNAVKSFCDAQLYSKPRTPKGLVYLSGWGSLRYAANSALICLLGADLGISSTAYRQFAQQQIHYMLGDNGRSFVVGFGTNSPQSPHHRSSSCPNMPASCGWNEYNAAGPNPQVLYGALVGGPDSNDAYTDARSDYQKNEVACDYNAGFQAAVAGLSSLALKGVTI